MKRAMGDWRGGWLTGWLAGIGGGGSSGDSSSEGKRRGEKEEEEEEEVEETAAAAEVEEEEEATVLRKADTRGGWEQCRSMPASQPASRPNPSESTALQFPNPLPRFSTPTSADSPGDKTRTAPRATPTYPATHVALSFSSSSLSLSSYVSLFLLAVSASQPLSRFIFPSFEALFRLWRTYSY